MLLKCFKVLSIQAVLSKLSPTVYCYKIVNECYIKQWFGFGNKCSILNWIELNIECPPPFEEGPDDNCYLFYQSVSDWVTARQYCDYFSPGADLVVIDNQTEFEWLVVNATSRDVNASWWIGNRQQGRIPDYYLGGGGAKGTEDYVLAHIITSTKSLIPGGPEITEQSILSIFQDFPLINSYFFTLLDRASSSHYINTKIIKFGWEFFILWVIFYGLSSSGFARFPWVSRHDDKLMANPENDSP